MNERMPWIKSRLFIIVLVTAIVISKNVEAARKPGVKAVILYTHDESAVGSSVVTMQVDQETFMNVIKSSQTKVLDAKPLRFIQDNGFFDLLEGDSTAFSFATSSGMADCDCKCSRRATTTTKTTTTTTTTPKPIITTSRPTTTVRFDPCGGRGSGPFCCENGVTNNKFCCENGAQNPTCTIATTPFPTRRTSTPAPTYLPPTTLPPIRADPCPLGGSGKYCCKNGASNIDCCENGGSGPFCCKNGASNVDCCANNGSGPNCCLNNGKGKYCCTNGFDNPTCSPTITVTRAPIITTTTTQRIKVTPPPIFISKKPVFQGPSYLPVARVTTERPITSTQTYTYGTRPSFKHSYSFTNAYWSYQPHSTRNYTTRAPSTTAKYEYQAPINGINYNGADDNSLF